MALADTTIYLVEDVGAPCGLRVVRGAEAAERELDAKRTLFEVTGMHRVRAIYYFEERTETNGS